MSIACLGVIGTTDFANDKLMMLGKNEVCIFDGGELRMVDSTTTSVACALHADIFSTILSCLPGKVSNVLLQEKYLEEEAFETISITIRHANE